MKNKKGIIIALVCIIAMFIPTYIAIANYVSSVQTPVAERVVNKIMLSDSQGEQFIFERNSQNNPEEIENDTISYFLALNDAANSTTSLPEPLVGTEHCEVTYYSYDVESVYEYYFSSDPDEAYFVDSNGNAYRITREYAEKFLNSSYSEYLYDISKAPVLTVSNGEVAPSSMVWQYLLYDDVTRAIETPPSSTQVQTVSLAGDLSLSFDIEPNYLNVKITEDGSTVYDGLYENLASGTLGEGSVVQVDITAEWYENIVRGSYGSASYSFTANVKGRPAFYLEETSILPGEFVVISGINVDDPSKVTFASEPAIDFEPVFFADGDYVRALVPIKVGLEDAEYYNFSVFYGDVVQSLTLQMEAKTFKTQGYDISSELIRNCRSETAFAEFDENIGTHLRESNTTKYWNGLFSEGCDAQIMTGFGLYRILTNSGETYRHEGVDYLVTVGSEARAVNDGVVVYAGYTAMTGNVVVVEHGFGLKSLYAHLSSISVTEGTEVTKDTPLGIVGSTGFTKGTLLHVGLYVFDTPVCPYSLWEEGIVIGE